MSVRAAAAAALVLPLVWAAPARGQTQTTPTYRIAAFDAEAQKHFTVDQMAVLEELNRRDTEHLIRLKEVIAPESWLSDEREYSPLPHEWIWAEQYPKLIVVHQPTQVFGAYENGRLVRWGPVSTGRTDKPTPAGFFHLTWRAKSRRSTENTEWLLKWYFNFINERGISFHEFELPGRPASHACVRLLERDAKWIYDWGIEWTLSEDRRHVDAEGTPVLIYGTFDFKRPVPWLTLDWWAKPIELPSAVNGSGGRDSSSLLSPTTLASQRE